MMIENPQKILIIRLSAIGDVLRTLPALRLLRKNFPHAHIAWAVEETAQDLLHKHPDLNEVIIVPKHRWLKQLKSGKGATLVLKEVYHFCRQIRSKNFDLTIDFHGLLKSGLISFFSGPPVRFGFSKPFTKECNFLFNNHRCSLETDKISRIERNLTLLQKMGINTKGETPIIHIPEYDQAVIQKFFKQKGIDKKRLLIAIHPGTSSKTLYKRWEPYRYAVVADRVMEDFGAQVIFTWFGDELALVKEIISKMKYHPIIACETKNLCQLAEIFKNCDLYFGGDTGPMHLAALLRTPVVAIFGPTDYVVNAPYKKTKHIIIRKEIDCSPCRVKDCRKRDCMKAIQVDDVLQAIHIIIDATKNQQEALTS
jgi:lipopolysaccharide heptosyltransferase I